MVLEVLGGLSVFLTIILGNFIGGLVLQTFGLDLPTLLTNIFGGS